MINKKSLPAGFRPQAALFDMDGLMLDTERPMLDLWIRAGGDLGWEISRETLLRTIGIKEENSREIFSAEYGPAFPYDEIKGRFFRLASETVEHQGINLRPGLLTLLDHLAKLKIPMAVATSTDRKTAAWKLEKAGIRDRFPVRACGDEVDRGKPAPDIFLLAASRLGKAPAQCVGFEDSTAGLQSLAAAGIASVFVKDVLLPPGAVLAQVTRQYDTLAQAVELFW